MTGAQAAERVDARRWFYHWMALACLAVTLVGFLPTYFVPIAQGTLAREPMVHLHGLLFFAWIVFFCWQTWLAAMGRVTGHREWGMVGVGLAAAMAFSVITVDAVRLNQTPAEPPIFAMIHLSGILFFETCVVAALASVRRPEVHKRFMLLATISLLGAPIGRWWGVLLGLSGGPASAASSLPSLDAGTLLLVTFGPPLSAAAVGAVAVAFDWSTRRRVSPIYAAGLPIYVVMSPVGAAIAATPAWLAVVDWIKHLGG
ncbi:MAG TPA: hypothetical protein VG942_05330 [Hyphomonadaceae bacterium]|nr:hypothetical protein [Hyphomonadaceae bacterium]